MSLFDLQDLCIVIGSIATLDLPMVVDLIGIYVLKGPYCTLTMTDWFLQALSVIPRGSWGDGYTTNTQHNPRPKIGRPSSPKPHVAAGHLQESPPPPRTAAAAPHRRPPPVIVIGLVSISVTRRIHSCQNPSDLLVQIDGGIAFPVVDLIRRSTVAYNSSASFHVILVGAGRLDASKLKVSCSGGTVASSRGDNLRWRVPVDWYTSRKIPVAEYQSQGKSLISYSSEMASSLISNSHHVDFDSVFGMDDSTITQMFELLIATGLKDFLGCPAVYYEAALIEFFENGSVREDGVVVSTIRGINVEISEGMFATAFGFRLREMKIEYRRLHDMLAKMLFVKAGSFDAVTHERFMLMTAITFDVKINWGSLLFGVLKAMVTPGSRQAKGYAIQICVVLSKVPGLELGESNPFPIHRVFTERTVHRFVHINEQIGMGKPQVLPQ
ncbi:dystroglycan-like [Dorcoceras hygrometricum]|uniref:Dystroglycan-like n=1 Tax=Dorcoceras hygrometricum TaxID=472368 RepID=A0A2Z7B5W7_9LAMI|nr:dystroglycan-like [Dorcoceras hygrometricum]